MEVLIIGSIAPIILIYLKTVFANRCTVDNQLFPSPAPPPEFPDFMSAFGGTLLRIGIENLWPLQERRSGACPYSVNWTAFNSRRCGSDPVDLDSFCRTLSITSEPPTSVAATAPTPVVTPENRSAVADVEDRVNVAVTAAADTKASTLFRSTEDNGGVFLVGDTTTEPPPPPPPFQSSSSDASVFPAVVLPSIRPDSAVSESLPPPTSQMSSLASPVDSSSFAASGAALTGTGGGADAAIGVTCGLAVLVVCGVVFFVIHFSRHRLCKCREVRRSVFKVIQRQRSDAQPLSTPPPSHPSTPLQVLYSNPMTTNNNNNVAEISDIEASRCLPVVR